MFLTGRMLLMLRGLIALALVAAPVARAASLAWTGPANGDWFVSGNWSGGSGNYPQGGDLVTVASGSILLTNSTANLGSLTITNATLTFTNWGTVLNAAIVTVQSSGVLTLPAPFTTNQMSNRVYVICTSLTVQVGGSINADAKGYAGQYGPGTGGQEGGGGYGGRGGYGNNGACGPVYGITNYPSAPGSGGGWNGSGNGHGGGLIWILTSNGAVQVDGTISANGGDGQAGNFTPGGSGGGILVVCKTVAGSGTIRANGGNGTSDNKGGGGGGRIAVLYDADAQAAAAKPGILFTVSPGLDGNGTVDAVSGTVYFPDTSVLPPVVNLTGYLYFGDGITNWSSGSLTISNGMVVLPSSFMVTVTNDLEMKSSGRLTMLNAKGMSVGGDVRVNNCQLHYGYAAGYPQGLTIASNLFLTNSGTVYLYAGPTNGTTAYGGLFDISGRSLIIPTNCAVYPASDPTNGGSIKMLIGDLTVAGGGSINADANGYINDKGPGTGASKGGGGYGGYGGDGDGWGGCGGDPYGSSNYPAMPGSGGSSYNYGGGNGGGLVWIMADSGAVKVDGILSANGETRTPAYYQPGGAGGGILVACRTFSGTGIVRANGGNGQSDRKGGGGGGRIAVWIGVPESARQNYITNGPPGKVIVALTPPTNNYPGAVFYTGLVSATNGTPAAWIPGENLATPGTVLFFSWPHVQGSIIRIR